MVLATGAAGAAQQNNQQQAEQTGQQQKAEQVGEGEEGARTFGREVTLEGLSDTAAREVYELTLQEASVRLGYRPCPEELPSGAGALTEYRCMARGEPTDQQNRLVVGLRTFATQHPRLYLWGQAAAGEQAVPNPDLEALAQAAREAMESAGKADRKFTPRELEHEVYQLSCIDTDSCLKTLGKLGYNTQPPKGQVNAGQLPTVFAMDQKSVKSVIGQKKLDDPTISSPEERLAIVYHSSQTRELAELKRVLAETVDVAARQVLIEGMVIELTEDDFKELGAEWEIFGDEWRKITFLQDEQQFPFIITYDPEFNPPADLAERLRTTIKMILEEGNAEVLSSPSVLVMDNRNAQVQVVRDVPIVESLVRENTTDFDVRFETVGVILNIKPRISQEGDTVAMQVLAEISEAPEEEFLVLQGQSVAPTINRRIVSTMARVRDNTPFIIGGLIRNEKATEIDRIPWISRIPVLGRLFQRRTDRHEKREVIVVLTPRVLKPSGTDRPVMPKDSERFDFLDNRLFRNSYRLKAEDVFDLGFLENNETIQRTMERARRFVNRRPQYADRSPFKEMVAGIIPGEDSVVMRMLYEVVRYKLKTHQDIKAENLIVFRRDPDSPAGFDVTWLADEILKPASPDGTLEGYYRREFPKEVLFLRFQLPVEGGLDAALRAPACTLEWVEAEDEEELEQHLLEINQLDEDYRYHEFACVLNEQGDMERLKTAVVLREIAKVNDFSELLRLSNFRVGRRLIIPEFDGPTERVLLIDHNVAEFFYKTDYYYHALRDRLEHGYEVIEEAITGEGRL
jgi:Flp pilus assembly secretin CpaC